MITVSTLSRTVTNIRVDDCIDHGFTDDDQVNSVTAVTPTFTARMIRVLGLVAFDVSENINTAHTDLGVEELVVKVGTVLDVLNGGGAEVRMAIEA